MFEKNGNKQKEPLDDDPFLYNDKLKSIQNDLTRVD